MAKHEDAAGKENAAPGMLECFAIMPITDPEGYEAGHFRRVFEDIFKPACEMAGYNVVRADEVRESNLIHLDVLQRLLAADMVLCDLSTRNPNVLFELGLRQAFDKPVVLVQEEGTPAIFDVAPLRYQVYRRSRVYHQVLEDQRTIAGALTDTRVAKGVNSMTRLLALTRPASLPEVSGAAEDPAVQLVRAEISALRDEMRILVRRVVQQSEAGRGQRRVPVEGRSSERLRRLADEIEHTLAAARRNPTPESEVLVAERLQELLRETEVRLSDSNEAASRVDYYRAWNHRLRAALEELSAIRQARPPVAAP